MHWLCMFAVMPLFHRRLLVVKFCGSRELSMDFPLLGSGCWVSLLPLPVLLADTQKRVSWCHLQAGCGAAAQLYWVLLEKADADELSWS